MGNNISSNKSDAASFKKSRYVQGQRTRSSSSLSVSSLRSPSPPIHTATSLYQPEELQQEQQEQENVNFGAAHTPIHAQPPQGRQKRPLKHNNMIDTPAMLPAISEKQRGKLPTGAMSGAETVHHLDKLPPSASSSPHHKRMKSQQQQQYTPQNRRSSKMRERYSSTISASGFSSTIGDPLHFSMVGDSTITDITNVSSFSVSSFLDKVGEDNNYIMSIPDSDFSSNTTTTKPYSTELASTTQDVLDLLVAYPDATYDILTSIFGSERMRSNPELQKEAFQAAETWSLRPTDVSAKIIVACCKLCGWGTSKNSKKGFQEIQALAKKGVWEAFYYLGQCYHYGVEQASEGYNLSGRPLSAHVIQPIDRDQAIAWYQKVVDTQDSAASERVQFYVAEAQFRIAAINFASGKINLDNVDENVDYLKQSVAAGNR